MAWSSNYDGSRILSINQMNSAKSEYNIFSYSSDKCPTKSELLATSVTTGGYRVTISGSYADNQLVPNSALNVRSTANNYTVNLDIYFSMDDYTTGTADWWYDKWVEAGEGEYTTTIPCHIKVYGDNSHSQKFDLTVHATKNNSYPESRNLYGINAHHSFSFSSPTNIIIEGFSVSTQAGIRFNSGDEEFIPTPDQGKNHSISMFVYMVM